jgi:hypothetical protein
MADAGTGSAKSEPSKLDAKEEQPVKASTSEQTEQEVASDLEAEVEQREEGRREDDLIEQQELNQGMDTGTRDSSFEGIPWGPADRIRETTSPKGKAKVEPDKTPDK